VVKRERSVATPFRIRNKASAALPNYWVVGGHLKTWHWSHVAGKAKAINHWEAERNVLKHLLAWCHL
jgi:hypothetical protein